MEIRLDSNDAQLSLWEIKDEPVSQVKMDELEPWYIWKLAVYQFDNKRWRRGWRPWKKET